ncbi:TEL2-interacting protein 1 [Pseudocercospora fuligena]|uniref:TEL2-interacting protein 1 n=1 Tax=Pseudocercospora fuligena TaxID=685502 RepID=A0A8H6RC43_9PEZI|nr:TEL2-interacting protein 1 [Pseudocercospora fuligena]
MEGRNDIFQRLKPPCVALSQAAFALNGANNDTREVVQRLEDLKHVLTTVTTRSDTLDAKLADYVFFPLSHVLKASQKASIRCLELSIQCLAILVKHGWRGQIQPQLAAQVVILCTLMAEKKPKGLISAESTDELQASALWCLHDVFTAITPASEARKSLASEANVPQIGQTISTILDGINDGGSMDVQVAGVRTLDALVKNIATRDIKAAFLPGIVSKLTKVLTPQTQQRRNHVVLVSALDILTHLFESVLGDHAADSVPEQMSNGRDPPATTARTDAEWFKTAAAQLKPALASILRLKDHGRLEVKEALAQLCFTVLKRCKTTLENCASMCLEVIVLLSSKQNADSLRFRLEAVVNGDPMICSILQNTLNDWLRSLPTRMQGADDQAKIQRMQHIRTARDVLVDAGVNTDIIDRELADVLRDSVVIILQLPGAKQQTLPIISQVQALDTAVIETQGSNKHFGSALARFRGQEEILDVVHKFTETISTSTSSNAFSADLARSLRQSHGDVQVASFWLLLEATRFALEQNSNADAFLNFDGNTSVRHSNHLEDLFAFSLDILADTSEEPTDQRLQALALQTLALRAQTTGLEFRYELIDALYPVLHTLATPSEQLQQDSIATLNIFTASCGYESVKDLIVENVDYLTNAVALKLNAFDVSPQAPQVMLMMVRLAGPGLLPYLEDTIESIFAALEDYHGYPLLVELLFRVLSVVAEEGSRAPQLAITDGVRKDLHQIRADNWEPTQISQLSQLLVEWAANNTLVGTPERGNLEPHPRRPWKSDLKGEEGVVAEEHDDLDEADEDGQDQPVDIPDPPPPAPKVYNLLLKISDLTQHFLPSASASLRTSLLMLIKTTTPSLARHDNSFLPLINTLWPEIVSRLEDEEPYVVATALDIIASFCEHAGDFMRSRIQQLWPALLETHSKLVKDIVPIAQPAKGKSTLDRDSNAVVVGSSRLKQALCRMRSAPTDYSDTSTRLVWTSLVHAYTAIVRYVVLQPEQFDEVLGILEPVLDDKDVREALEVVNFDAVWLIRLRNGDASLPSALELPHGLADRFAAVPG